MFKTYLQTANTRRELDCRLRASIGSNWTAVTAICEMSRDVLQKMSWDVLLRDISRDVSFHFLARQACSESDVRFVGLGVISGTVAHCCLKYITVRHRVSFAIHLTRSSRARSLLIYSRSRFARLQLRVPAFAATSSVASCTKVADGRMVCNVCSRVM